MESKRIDWLAIVRGLNILLVVMFHVQLVDMTTGENHFFCEQITSIFTPLRIPLFIFISGGLLYLSRIRKEWKIFPLYKDKFQRIMLPFFFFVTIYFSIKVLMRPLVKTQAVLSVGSYFESFVKFQNHPSAPLWFLATLMTLMMMYPLFRKLCQKDIYMYLFFVFSCVFYYIDFSAYEEYNYFYLLSLNNYLVYFFFGIYFFRFKIYRHLDNFWVFLIFTGSYLLLYTFEVSLATSLCGILMMVSLCMLLARRMPKLFSSFREYIFQVYLMSLIFQAFVELVLWKRVFYNENFFLFFYLLNVLAGIYMPVLISKGIERCPIKIIRLCFGLK